eukprot:5989665-Prymnesium_polylepis.1
MTTQVDYHYQQFYLQLKMQKAQQAAAARTSLTPRNAPPPTLGPNSRCALRCAAGGGALEWDPGVAAPWHPLW